METSSAAALAALGVYVFMEAWNWPYYNDDGPGPAFFPLWYGAGMVVLSLPPPSRRPSPSCRRRKARTGRELRVR